MESENKPVVEQLTESETIKRAFEKLRPAEFDISTTMAAASVDRPEQAIRQFKSTLNLNMICRRPFTGDAGICRPYQTAPATRMSDMEILGLEENQMQPSRPYHKIFLANYAGPEFRRYISRVDDFVNSTLVNKPDETDSTPCKLDETDPSPCKPDETDSSPCKPSEQKPKVDVWVKSDFENCLAKRRWSSLPNIHMRFGPVDDLKPETTLDEVSSDATGLGSSDDPAVQPRRRRTMWSRTKRFVRRMFCFAF